MERERIFDILCQQFETAVGERNILWKRFEATSRFRIIISPPEGVNLHPASHEYSTAEERVMEARNRLNEFLADGTIPEDLQGPAGPDADPAEAPCAEWRHLEKAYRDARAAFESAYAQFQSAAALSRRSEHRRLERAAGRARQALERASGQLYRHILDHGCEPE